MQYGEEEERSGEFAITVSVFVFLNALVYTNSVNVSLIRYCLQFVSNEDHNLGNICRMNTNRLRFVRRLLNLFERRSLYENTPYEVVTYNNPALASTVATFATVGRVYESTIKSGRSARSDRTDIPLQRKISITLPNNEIERFVSSLVYLMGEAKRTSKVPIFKFTGDEHYVLFHSMPQSQSESASVGKSSFHLCFRLFH